MNIPRWVVINELDSYLSFLFHDFLLCFKMSRAYIKLRHCLCSYYKCSVSDITAVGLSFGNCFITIFFQNSNSSL